MNDRRYGTLCDILFFRWLLALFMWGLPALLGPRELFDLLGVPLPDNMFILRLLGAVSTSLSLLYWYAWKAPIKQQAIIKVAIIENGLATLILWALILATGFSGWFVWISSLLTAFFFITILVLSPSKEVRHAVTHERVDY